MSIKFLYGNTAAGILFCLWQCNVCNCTVNHKKAGEIARVATTASAWTRFTILLD